MDCCLEKFPGKGGWTYIPIPGVEPDPHTPFGWVRVNGKIDQVEIRNMKLLPKGDGTLFLPVKKEIRRILRKEAGEFVRLVIYESPAEFEIPAEILECFENEPPEAGEYFHSLPVRFQKEYIDWIYDGKTREEQAKRILKMMDRLCLRKRLYGLGSEKDTG